VLPDPGTPFQLVHHDDVAERARGRDQRRRAPGAYNLAGEGTITLSDLAHQLGWLSVPVPRPLLGPASLGARLPLMPTIAQWVNAGRVPVVMDTSRARRELSWRPRYSTRETLRALVAA
jgi:nucleoside-diphosphate-sugar epimerase